MKTKACYRSPRRGGVLVAVLVVMTVASLLFAAMLRTNRQELLLLRSHQQQLQAVELGQAGLERAAARLSRDAAYKTEVWQIPAAELGGHDDAAVSSEVHNVADRPRRRRVEIVVDYPALQQRRVRHRQEAVIDLPERTALP